MVPSIVGQQQLKTDQAPRELTIQILQDASATYTGTAAQLVAEGLIPQEFSWPKATVCRYWEAGGFKFELRRTRPEGHKGPMRSWLELDNWSVEVRVIGRNVHWQTRRRLERQSAALKAEYWRQTAEGAREWNAAWNRYWQTKTDERFQAFKALIPSLVRPKRGRKPKAE